MTTRAAARLAADQPIEAASADAATHRPAPDRVVARLEQDAADTAETAAAEAHAVEVARRDNDRASLLRALMPLISGENGKRLAAALKGRDIESFRAVWGKVTTAIFNRVNPEALGTDLASVEEAATRKAKSTGAGVNRRYIGPIDAVNNALQVGDSVLYDDVETPGKVTEIKQVGGDKEPAFRLIIQPADGGKPIKRPSQDCELADLGK